MVNINPALCNTELHDRVLWFDGDSSVSPETLLQLILKGVSVDHLKTLKMTKDIEQFNTLSCVQISKKENVRPFKYDWTFNSVFQSIDVEDFIFEALQSEIQGKSSVEQKKRIKRTLYELELYKELSLIPILKLMIYIIDSFEQQGIVWGVGRGSSVSSYVLYLIGVHDVDSVEFDLPIEDFLTHK